jgi:adenine-specific DNA-methyltransferase
MARKTKTNGSNNKRVTRYTYESVMEPRTPETGHTALLPAEEQVVTVPMDNGWTKAMKISALPEGDNRPVVLDMDPAADPSLFWAGKRNRRQVPILPLQRNEIVSDSRIAKIIERARKLAEEKAPQMKFASIFADLEKTLRESDKAKRVEFYTHDEGWKNKVICGDSLQVMESLLHYEGVRGKVQLIYMDPPYGIKYDSNFQQRVDSTKNDESDQADDVLTIKAFRDTWALGIHSYLSYLQERLYLCRELLTESGSVFVQINQENAHVLRNLLDEVFGAANFISTIVFTKTGGQSSSLMPGVYDVLLWYAKDKEQVAYQQIYLKKEFGGAGTTGYTFVESPDEKTWRPMTTEERADQSKIQPGWKVFDGTPLSSAGESKEGSRPFDFYGRSYTPPHNSHWKTTMDSMRRLAEKGRIIAIGNRIEYKRYFEDFPYIPLDNIWLGMGERGFVGEKWYSVQTDWRVVARCIAMTTRPGDLIFDPTCGSGTTAFASERLGRRWITCDTSRVAVNVARQRLLSACFDHFPTRNGRVSSGFIYKTVPRVTLKSIGNDLEPEKVEMIDQPETEKDSVRVAGPFEVMSLGRYSVEDWKGYFSTSSSENGIEAPKLENYIGVVSRLYRKDAAVQGASGLVHAVVESEKEKIALSVGPLSGRVTAKQIDDAVKDALASGILETHVLGWAFESNVNEVKAQLEKRGKVKVELIVIRPDTLAEGLKVTKSETLFSPLALPDIEVELKNGKEPKAVVRLKGVAVFDRKNRTTDYKHADSGYVSAWYLDEDYDGDCFVDCQMFFDFKKAPNLKALGIEVELEEFKFQAESQMFPVRGYKRIAVKVVDVFGNESTVVREL